MKSLVVGAGAIARQHLGCLTRLPAVDEIHVCDLSAVTARAMADRFGLAGWTTDLEQALADVRPDVVHVTTPPSSHFEIARRALEVGCHVVIEKPATLDPHDLVSLVELAEQRGLLLVEDYNYLFNPRVHDALQGLADGAYGDLVHVDVSISLEIFGEGSPYLDPALNRSFQHMRGGPIADFLPHLASVAHAFVGRATEVQTAWTKSDPALAFPADGFRALVTGEVATATLGFSSRAQPDLFAVRVEGTRKRTSVNVFEGFAAHQRQLGIARPLLPVVNGLREGLDVGLGGLRGLSGKLSGGAGAYQGLWRLVELVYAAVDTGTPPPVTTAQMLEVTALVEALTEGLDESPAEPAVRPVTQEVSS